MVTVDSEGRIMLPADVREALNLTPGSEVEVCERNERAIIQPVRSSEEIIRRMEELMADPSEDELSPGPYDGDDPLALDHIETIRKAARSAKSDHDAE